MSTEKKLSRRGVLKTAGVVAAAGGTGAALTGLTTASSSWTEVDSPTGKSFKDVVETSNGAYAVGSSGNIATKTDGSWELVVDSGPSNSNNSLNSVDVTSDGKRIWFAGGSGALGAFDVETGKKYDHTAPQEKTSTWEGIAVTGELDNERVLVANGSGEVLDGTRDQDDCMKWGEVNKPAGGSTIPELAFASDDPSRAYGIDTSQEAFQSEDLNDTWTDIGVPDAQEAFYDLVGTTDQLYVAAGSGVIYRLECDCDVWTPVDAGENDLRAIDRTSSDDVITSANGGAIYERTADGWTELDTPTQADLLGISYGATDVAVGSSGTILER